MKVVIDGKTIHLIDRDVKVAKQTIRHFLETSKKEAEKNGSSTYYYTLLVAMHLISADMINAYTPDVLAAILNIAAEHDEEKHSNGTKH